MRARLYPHPTPAVHAMTPRIIPTAPGQGRSQSAGADMKARQSSKIRELGDVLVAVGFETLDQQAEVLGLARSTTWTILKGNHKASGLSATVINRMLAAPQLPAAVRATIHGYIDEKAAGLYGHSKVQLRRFVARLANTRGRHPRTRSTAQSQDARKTLGRVPRTHVAFVDEALE
jgi:hypothetical protein